MEKTKRLSQSELDGVQYRRAKTWHIVLAQLSNGANMAFYVLTTLLAYLGNEGYGIAVATVGFILTATRVFDGVVDPILAVFIDKINTRFGKLRILMMGGWAIKAIAVLMLYVWCSGKGFGIVFFVAVYLVYIVGASMADIAGNMLPAVMSNDPRQRPQIGVWGTIYAYLFPMAFSIVTNIVILPRYGNEYTVPMLATTCIFFLIASLVLQIICCIGVTPIDKPEFFEGLSAKDEKNKVKVGDMLRFVKDNRPFQMYTIACASDKLAQQTGSQAIVTTMLYGILIGDMQLGTMISVITMLPSIIFAIIGARHAGKHGAKQSTVTWTWICLGFAALSVAFCLLVDLSLVATSTMVMIGFFVLLLGMNASKMSVTTASTAMRADIVDYELDRSGKYLPAVVTATYNFIDKLISSLDALIATGCVALIGFRTVLPQPTDTATTPILLVTLFLYYGMPILGWLCTIVAMKFYKLDKNEMVNVQKRIQVKKEEIAQ